MNTLVRTSWFLALLVLRGSLHCPVSFLNPSLHLPTSPPPPHPHPPTPTRRTEDSVATTLVSGVIVVKCEWYRVCLGDKNVNKKVVCTVTTCTYISQHSGTNCARFCAFWLTSLRQLLVVVVFFFFVCVLHFRRTLQCVLDSEDWER